eukprot:TRINITY_DN10825_c0_g1_i1.p1 TRINITY_DN10825_c0_g1~~TRINITY_DN10825_c0_g1_i1.p1  ORF type:complete len:716 (-),score=138.44 TRINITY_DN10825_c0_g1_i1:135-2282(-)
MECFVRRRTSTCLKSALEKFAGIQRCSYPLSVVYAQPISKPSASAPKFYSLNKYRCFSGSAADSSEVISEVTPLKFQNENPEDEEALNFVNDFLERFVAIMRTKLSEAYPDASAQVVEQMLVIIVDRIVEEIENGSFLGSKSYDAFVQSRGESDFSADLWKLVWSVSKFVIEEIRKTETKQQIQDYLQSDEMKKITKFAKDVGITGELMKELKMDFAEEKKAEIEFFRHLNKMAGEDRLSNLLRMGGQMLKKHKPWSYGEDETGSRLPRRSAKMKFRVYGMDLSHPRWTEIGERLQEAESDIVPEVPVELSGKCNLIMKRILELGEDADPAHLLAQLNEDMSFSRAEWLCVLHHLNESKKKNLVFKVTEYVLDQDSFEAGIRDYTKILDAYAKEERVSDAERILQKMEEKGFVRDPVTCNILINMYSKRGDLDRAREAFNNMKSFGLQPGQEVYSLLIMAYVKAGLPTAAEALMREMDAKDTRPDTEIYMALLKAFAEKGLVEGAQRIFNGMQFAGIMPTLESCTLLIKAYGQAADPDQARNVFDFMMQAGHKPDDRCMACMLSAYERKNLFDKAVNLLSDAEKKGFKLGVESSAVLIDWLGKLGLVDEAENLLKENFAAESVPIHVKISLCDAYARTGLADKALEMLSVIEAKATSLNPEGFERLITGLSAGGLVNEAKKMHDHMQSKGFVPSEPVKVALMAAQAISHRSQARR